MFVKVCLLACAVIACSADTAPLYRQPAAPALGGDATQDSNAIPPEYNFRYDISASSDQVYLGHTENRKNDDTIGSYFWVGPDGAKYTVTYKSSPTGGYEAEVQRDEGAVDMTTQAPGYEKPAEEYKPQARVETNAYQTVF